MFWGVTESVHRFLVKCGSPLCQCPTALDTTVLEFCKVLLRGNETSPYCPNLALIDFHLLSALKEHFPPEMKR